MRENNGGRSRRRFRHDHESARVSIPSQPCGICEQPIVEMASAIGYGPAQAPAHFDCVLTELTKQQQLEGGEKVAYLGSGTFGVIIEKEGTRFEIHRKIPVEDPNNPPAWRKELRNLYKK